MSIHLCRCHDYNLVFYKNEIGATCLQTSYGRHQWDVVLIDLPPLVLR
jgi:hypothetical protein